MPKYSAEDFFIASIVAAWGAILSLWAGASAVTIVVVYSGIILVYYIGILITNELHGPIEDGLTRCMPEVTDVYAWKIVKLYSGNLGPVFYNEDGTPYNLFGANHYSDFPVYKRSYRTGKTLFRHSSPYLLQAYARERFPILDNLDGSGSSGHGHGFYSFKSHQDAFNEIGGIWTPGQYLIAKIRIWGTTVECVKGYKSEYFEFVELYSKTHTSNDVPGWPFKIKRFTSLGTQKDDK